MLGGLALKWRWRQKREQAGKPTGKPNLVCGPVQICWPKFAKYFDVELREIPCEGRRLLMSPEEVLKRCDENTIGVVATLGSLTRCNMSRCKRWQPRWMIWKRSTDSTSDPRGCGERWVYRAVYPSCGSLGLSNSAGEIDQHFGA